MNKEHDRLMAAILLLTICMITFIWAVMREQVAEARVARQAAMEASYGEPAKPEGHGK